MQMNKQGTLSCRNVLSLHQRHWSSQNRGQWLLSKLPECSAPKTQTIASRLVYALLIYLPTLCISITFVISLNDVMITCFPPSAGKTLHMHRKATLACLHICQHPCQPISKFPTVKHGPSHQFHIPSSKPVTLSLRYFSVPLYWSLKFIKNSM